MDPQKYQVETLTLNELTVLFRSFGIQTSETKLGDGIEQGAYPFGVCIRGQKRQFEIYRRKVEEWLSERVAARSST